MGAISELHSFNTLVLRCLVNIKSIQQFEDPFRVNRELTHGDKWACAFGGDFRASLTRECRLKLFIADVSLHGYLKKKSLIVTFPAFQRETNVLTHQVLKSGRLACKFYSISSLAL